MIARDRRVPSLSVARAALALGLAALGACGGQRETDASPIPSTGVPVAAQDARGVEPPPADVTLLGGSPPPSPFHKKPPVSPLPPAPPLPGTSTPDPFAPPLTPPPAPPQPTSTGVPL